MYIAEYTGSGSGTTGPLNLTKTGACAPAPDGPSSYTGTTTVSAGTLQVDGVLGATSVIVQTAQPP